MKPRRYERVQRMREISCVVLALKKGRLLPLWSTVLLFCRRLRKKFIDVLLSSLSYSSRHNLHVAKCEVSSFVTVFSVFPALFSA